MRGDEWNQLVAAPSALEIDAALAEVRLRAVPIARRRATLGRWAGRVGGLALMAGAFVAGDRFAAGGVHAVDNADGMSPGLWTGSPVALAEPGAGIDSGLVFTGRRRFRVTSWQELDGQRFDEEDAWIEGPMGTGIAVAVGDPQRSAQLLGWIGGEQGSVAQLYLTYSIRTLVGASRRDLPVYEEGSSADRLLLTPGQAGTITLFRPARSGEAARMLRIEGPQASAPARAVAWDSATPNLRGFRLNPYDQAENPAALRMRGIRWSHPNVRRAHLYAWGVYRLPYVMLRVSVPGRQDAGMAYFPIAGDRTLIPGVEDSVAVWMKNPPWAWAGGTGNCFLIRRLDWRALERDRARGHEPFRAEGCFDLLDISKAVEVLANNGQRLRVQVVLPAQAVF